MPTYLPAGVRPTTRVMVFVDGENLAIRYGAMLDGAAPLPHIVYEKDVYVWSRKCNIGERVADVIRRFYFTSADQDELRRQRVFQALKDVGSTLAYFRATRRKGRSKLISPWRPRC